MLTAVSARALRRLVTPPPGTTMSLRSLSSQGASLQKAVKNSAKAAAQQQQQQHAPHQDRSSQQSTSPNGHSHSHSHPSPSPPSASIPIKASTLDALATPSTTKDPKLPSTPPPPSVTMAATPKPQLHQHPHLQAPPQLCREFAPKICVVGVGGAGGNAVNNMIMRGLSGVDFVVANTDAQHLATTLTENRLQLGRDITQGLGCGANPDVGRIAGEESKAEILERVGDAHMVFITAGMGGGTGTGAAPIIAQTCLEAGLLTVGVVTRPFRFEGTHRMRLAEEGIRRLQTSVDTLIVIPNQNLFKLVDPTTTLMDAFRLADDVLLAGVKSVTDLMTMPGLINLDFADVQSVMAGMGNAIMGTGQAQGEDRAMRAAEDALRNPLLGEVSVKTAKGMLVNITGGSDMTLFEVDKAAQRVTEEVEDESANIIFGSAYDSTLEGSIRVSVVATGIDDIKH